MSVVSSLAGAIAPYLGVGAIIGLGWAGKSASRYFSAKAAASKDDAADAALARVTSGMSRIAGEIGLDVAPLLGTGADLKTVIAASVASGLPKLKARFPNDLSLLQAGDDLLGSMLNGEVGKVVTPLIAQVTASGGAAPAPTVSTETLLTHAISTLGKVAAGALTAASVAGAATAAVSGGATLATTGEVSELKDATKTVTDLVSGTATGAAAKVASEAATAEQQVADGQTAGTTEKPAV